MSDNIAASQHAKTNGNFRKDTIQTPVPRITPSSVADLSCPKKYHTLRVLKQWPAREPLDAAAYGTAVHRVLREVYARRSDGQPDLRRIEAIAKAAVYAGYFSKEYDREQGITKVIQAVQGFVDSDDLEDVEGTISLEESIEFPYRHNGQRLYMVSATLDRVLIRASQPNRLVIRDYKTTRPKIDLQAALIMLWSAKEKYKGFDSYSLELDWQDDEYRIRRDTIEGHHVRGQHALITQAALRIINANDYPAEPNDSNCTYCPLRTSCQQLPDVEFADGEDVF